MPFETIQYEVSAPLARIRLNRPEKLNAIDANMVNELNVALSLAESDEQVRAIVISGKGKAFSAGFDLEEETTNEAATRAMLERDFELIMRFWNGPKPTLAAVHGYCLGGAMELAIACDITIAAEDSRFGAPEVQFGSGIVAMLAPWLAGPKKAKEWLLSGETDVGATELMSQGLVNRVVPTDCVNEEAESLALRIAGNDALAVRLTKRAINRSLEVAGMHRALRDALETDIEIETTETDESREFNRILKEQGARAAIRWREQHQQGDESHA